MNNKSSSIVYFAAKNMWFIWAKNTYYANKYVYCKLISFIYIIYALIAHGLFAIFVEKFSNKCLLLSLSSLRMHNWIKYKQLKTFSFVKNKFHLDWKKKIFEYISVYFNFDVIKT